MKYKEEAIDNINKLHDECQKTLLIKRYFKHLSWEKFSENNLEGYINILEKESDYYQQKKKRFSIKIITKIVQKSVRSSRYNSIKEIYLVGSYAKRLNDSYSDVDLLVKFDNNLLAAVVCPVLKSELLDKYKMSTDIIPSIIGNPSTFDLSVLDYGIKIYQKIYN